MKQKNLVKKALFPAIIALLCSFVALTSVSYAWFTMGDTAKVEGMQMQVTSADGLQISASGNEGTFKSTLTLSDLGETTGKKTGVIPVSTDGVLASNELKFYTVTVENGVLTKTTEAEDKNYIMFDIYVKVAAGKKAE